jgi:kynurenine 3-monooxygenase
MPTVKPFVQGDRKQALREFSKERAVDARALVQVSHNADQGFVFFVLPIILDRIFHRLAPWLFQTSVVRLMQRPDVRYSDAQRRKRIDRALQVGLIGSILSCIFTLFWKVVTSMWRAAAAAFAV